MGRHELVQLRLVPWVLLTLNFDEHVRAMLLDIQKQCIREIAERQVLDAHDAMVVGEHAHDILLGRYET